MMKTFTAPILTFVLLVCSLILSTAPFFSQNTAVRGISHAGVRLYKGSPTMFIDGSSTAAMTFTVTGKRRRNPR